MRSRTNRADRLDGAEHGGLLADLAKACVHEHSDHLILFGQVDRGLGEVAVGGIAADPAAEAGDDTVEVEAVAEADGRVSWAIDFEETDPATGRDDPAEFANHRLDRGEVAKREARNGDGETAIGEREVEGIALEPEAKARCALSGREEHSAREIEANRFGGTLAAVFGKIAGTTGEVENAIAGANLQALDEFAPPALIGAEGH